MFSLRSAEIKKTEDDCPICLQRIERLSITNCGHAFCSDCLLKCWDSSDVTIPLSCPCCRQTISYIHETFSRKRATLLSSTLNAVEVDRTIASIRLYNSTFSKQRGSVLQLFKMLPLLISWLVDEILNGRGIIIVCTLRFLLFFSFCLFYTISPLDLLPEGIFGIFGLIDDVFILIAFIVYAASFYTSRMADLQALS